MNTLSVSIRVGIVSSVNTSEKTARVYYTDSNNTVSGWLYVLQRDDDWMPDINDRVLCLISSGEDADGYILGVIE